jgi:hypothetical protein
MDYDGWVCAHKLRDRLARRMVLVTRNVLIATAVAVPLLVRTEFAVFAAAYFSNQVSVSSAALVLVR